MVGEKVFEFMASNTGMLGMQQRLAALPVRHKNYVPALNISHSCVTLQKSGTFVSLPVKQSQCEESFTYLMRRPQHHFYSEKYRVTNASATSVQSGSLHHHPQSDSSTDPCAFIRFDIFSTWYWWFRPIGITTTRTPHRINTIRHTRARNKHEQSHFHTTC